MATRTPKGPPKLVNICYGLQMALNEHGYMGARCIGVPVQRAASEVEQRQRQQASKPVDHLTLSFGKSVMPASPDDLPVLLSGVQLGIPSAAPGPADSSAEAATAVAYHVEAAEAHERALELRERLNRPPRDTGEMSALLREVRATQAEVKELRERIAAQTSAVAPPEAPQAGPGSKAKAKAAAHSPEDALVQDTLRATGEADTLRRHAGTAQRHHRRGSDASGQVARQQADSQMAAARRELGDEPDLAASAVDFWRASAGHVRDLDAAFMHKMLQNGSTILGNVPSQVERMSATFAKMVRGWGSRSA